MKHLIISYKSRNTLLAFSKLLRTNGINSTIINTPRTIAVSCGLSINTDFRFLGAVSALVKQTALDGFIGIFAENQIAGSFQYQRLL